MSMENGAQSNLKPNIVLFMVDQLSAKWLEAAVNGTCQTPNIDKLRENGVTFTNTIASNPICAPSRATIATGQTSRGHGVLDNSYYLDPKLPTFMKCLKNNGWATGAFGKCHHRPHFAGFFPDYKKYGYDETHITEDGRGGEWLDWVRKKYPEHLEDVLATIRTPYIEEYENYGEKNENIKEKIENIRSNYKWANKEFPNNYDIRYTLPFPEEISQTEWITRNALDFINQTAGDQLFFAHISYVQPHSPSSPPARFMKYVNEDHIPKPAPAEWVHDPNVQLSRHSSEPEKHDWLYARKCYFADISHLDNQLGKLMDTLDRKNILDQTYIFFLSDHGDLLFDHGFCNKEERHYDACIRVPLIISGPDVKHGSTYDNLVQLEDICPTILDLTSLQFPNLPVKGPYLDKTPEEITSLSGDSLVPILFGNNLKDERSFAYTESYNSVWSISPKDWARTIRTHNYRYTYYPKGGGEQLFNLKEDPDEQNNLVAEIDYQNIRKKLKDELLEQIILQDVPKPRRNLFALGVH